MRAVVDVNTGEILDHICKGDRILRGKSAEFLSNTTKMNVKSFVKLNIDEVTLVLPTLTSSEQAMLINLIPYMSYRSCCLQYSNGRDINLDSIVSITKMSRNTVIKAIEGLISKDILYKGRNSKNNQYFVNPWIANKGMVVDNVLRQMFKNYRIKSLGNIKWDNL